MAVIERENMERPRRNSVSSQLNEREHEKRAGTGDARDSSFEESGVRHAIPMRRDCGSCRRSQGCRRPASAPTFPQAFADDKASTESDNLFKAIKDNFRTRIQRVSRSHTLFPRNSDGLAFQCSKCKELKLNRVSCLIFLWGTNWIAKAGSPPLYRRDMEDFTRR